MGVTGLWRLIEPAGKPVPLETLENKVLAVDISIWLHQMVKGYQDARGGTVVNAHLLGLFQRLCKLLYYKIKPVFVFDGGVPVLKIQTISRRQSNKSKMHNTVERMRRQLLEIATKQLAVDKVIYEKKKTSKQSPLKPLFASPENDDNLFKLPPMENKERTISQSDDSDSEDSQPNKHVHMDLHSVDVNSEYFKSLTLREKHDLLTELKETRKQSSWGKIHELPTQSDNFSDYQMKRLLKRRQVQVSLEETEKEMGGRYLSINELEILLNEEGIDTKITSIPTRQIASDENTHFVLIKDVKEALENAAKKELENNTVNTDNSSMNTENSKPNDSLGKEYDEDLQAALQLSLQCCDEPSSSKMSTSADATVESLLTESDFISSDSEWESDEESDIEYIESKKDNSKTNLALVKAYMLENSGLTEHEIKRIINKNNKNLSNTNSRLKTQLNQIQIDHVMSDGNSTGSSTLLQYPEIESNKLEPSLIYQNIEIDHVNKNQEILQSQDTNVKDSLQDETGNKCTKIVEPNQRKDISTEKPKEGKILAKKSFSDSDTDDSFEEVEDNNVVQRKVEIEVNYQLPPDNDIFADIFKNENSTIRPSIELNKTVNANENKIPSERDKKESNQMSCNIDYEVESKYTTNFITKDKNSVTEFNDDNTQSNIHIKSSNKLEVITNHGLDTAVESGSTTHDTESYTSQVNNEHAMSPLRESTESVIYSPQKGMTLNEVKRLVAQENVKDTKEPESKSIENQLISTDDLLNIADDLEKEKEKLQKEQNKLDRMGRNISEEMTKDAQHLLKLFGIPYIIAPMEAEAQCAFLEAIKLTDGTITDDSDIWLFGGRNVYKNFFNQQKYVLQFLSENIENCFKLSRQQLILLALLVGSDYTTGVSGVGPVTAMEILSTFPVTNLEPKPSHITLVQGLKKFKSWWNDNRAYGHGKLRNKLKNISINQDFPSHKVVEAYLEPHVDKSNDTFSWGKPDVTALRDYARQKFGWSQTKTDEILKPVLKRLDEKISQQSIRSFFQTEIKKTQAVESMSKRVRKAVEQMDGNIDSDEDKEFVSKSKKSKRDANITENVSGNKGIAQPALKIKRRRLSDKCDSNKPNVVPKQNQIIDNKDTNSKGVSVPFIPERYQESIPQREHDKALIMQNKLKAIELFRTSKKGPGFVKKRGKNVRQPKLEAGLSESDSD